MVGLATALTLVFASSSPAPTPADPRDIVQSTIDEFSMPGIHARPRYLDCGFINAAYIATGGFIPWGDGTFAEAHDVIVCNELLKEDPEFLRFIIGHEMSHAIVDQYNLPTTGSQEAAADELAAVVLLADGHRDSLLATSGWFKAHDDGDPNTYDEHPSNARRSYILGCYAQGAVDSGAPHCHYLLTHAAISWARLIAMSGGQ